MIIFSVAVAVLFISAMPCRAYVALPPDAGINYETMKVTDASQLRARGMKGVSIGDVMTIRVAKDKSLWIINNRTGERIIWTYSE